MKFLTIAISTAVMTTAAFPGFAQVQQRHGAVVQASPNAQAILAKQMKDGRPKYKTTQTAERLISFDLGGTYTDDTTCYYYSGTNGSPTNTFFDYAYLGTFNFSNDFFDLGGFDFHSLLQNNLYERLHTRSVMCDSLYGRFTTSGLAPSDWRKTFLYNANDQLLCVYMYGTTASGTPYLHKKDTFYYNAAAQLTTIHDWYNDTTGAGWVDTFYAGYTYNAAGNLTEDSMLRHKTATWAPMVRDLYNYDAAGNILWDSTVHWDSGTGTWLTGTADHYKYDADNRLTVQAYYENNSFGTYTFDTFSYTGNAVLPYYSTYTHSDAGVAPTRQRSYYFMSAPTQIDSASIQAFSPALNQWVTGTQVLTNYNSFGDATEQLWIAGTDTESVSRWHYELYDPTGITPPTAQPLQYSLYPNPAHNQLTINTRTQVPDGILITDITGKQMTRIVPATATTVVPTGSYAPGIYLVTVQAGAQVSTQRVRIVR